MKAFRNPKWNKVFFWTGFLSVLLMAVPYLILGQDAVLVYHDQLDGEVIAYLLQAKHLFDGDMLPEFLGGVGKTALIPPAPACVLFFLGGNAFWGLVTMQLLGSLCGYVGMYLCIKRVSNSGLPAMVTGVLFAYLPFLPVYGLSQYGLPLLLYLVWEAADGRHKKKAFCYGIVYALTSSLVLVGFGVLGVMALWILWKYKEMKQNAVMSGEQFKVLVSIWGAMLFVYVLENIGLLAQTLGFGGAKEVSHKGEYTLLAGNFVEELKTALLYGGQHSEDFHKLFLVMVLVVAGVGVGMLKCDKAKEKNASHKRIEGLLKVIGGCLLWNLFFAVAAAFWNAEPGVYLRSHLSVLGAFQMDRLLWMAPCLWYVMFGCAMALTMEFWKVRDRKGNIESKASKALALILSLALFVTVGITGVQVLLGSNVKPNIQKLRNPEYPAISFNDYYAVGVYEQIEEFLAESFLAENSRETKGCEKSEYRVVSLGIDPAAALYHGFYCLDGYSNNYPLSYKHAFRNIIAPELEKSDYLKEYFDGWGNRCYLLSAECPGYYTVEKGGFFFADLDLNMTALRDMGAEYLFSAAYIANAEELGMTLLREEPFTTPDSYYQIYVYSVE